MLQEDEEGPVKTVYLRQSSWDLHHYNQRPVSVDQESIKSAGIDPRQVPWWTSKRFRLSVLCFFGFACLYALRVNLSIAMVCMVRDDHYNNTYTASPDSTTSNTTSHYSKTTDAQQCPVQASSHTEGAEFLWDKSLQGLLLGAFFWGYLVLQVPGGMLSERFGAKKVIAAGMFPVAILNMLTPFAARGSPYLLLAVRVIVGIGESVMYPASQALWANWSPPWERSRLIGISLSGGQFGNALIFPIGGLLCSYGFDGGWASIFYVIGSLGLLWCVIWTIFAHDQPDSTPGISDLERKYISKSLEESKKQPKARTTPWRAIFSSGPVWAIIIAHTCGNYGIYMLLTQIPTYMKEVLKFDIKQNGVYSMLPYLCFWACISISGLLADFLILRKILSVTWTRKVLSLIGMLGPAVSLIGVAHMDCTQHVGAVILLCGAVGLCGFHFSGYFINHGDIAPNYAGTLFGITNTAATVPGILAPYIVGAITPNKSQEEWQTAFYICAGVYIFGALVYLVFGSGKIRHWAKVIEKLEDENVSLRKPIVNGHRKSRTSQRGTYFDNEESHVTIECDPGESYAESAIV
ncbi:sialin-like isoform X2 [Haliotis rufescens]|nr:sialin-like isoform X2 [Haliotis rufescens]